MLKGARMDALGQHPFRGGEDSMKKGSLFLGAAAALLFVAPLVVALSGCQTSGPLVSSQTNWLRACDSADDCGDLSCICGACTASCDGENDCEASGLESCVLASEAGAAAVCGGKTPTVGMCLPRCDEEACPSGMTCVAGVCAAGHDATESVSVDTSVRHQTLIGFGASLGYSEDYVVGHAEKESLFDAMFSESGFEVLRLGNRFVGGDAAPLDATAEIVAAAEQRLGRAPVLFLTSGSPPAALKANGDRYCNNSNPLCTLTRDAGGGFDYAGFAEYWRSSLEAYAGAGIVPDFVSIQNNAGWVPPGDVGAEACRFLGAEGTASVTLPDNSTVDAEFPGYSEALSAVLSAVEGLSETYEFAGPETGNAVMNADFSESLTGIDAVATNFYAMNASDVDVPALEASRDLAEQLGAPLLQTEVYANAEDTAVLIHHALTTLGASAYLQQGFVGPSDNLAEPVLIGGSDTGFEKHDTYYVMSHYALFTDPEWVRVQVESSSEQLLSTGFLSPEGDRLTLVFVNWTAEEIDLEVEIEEPELLVGMRLYRTVLGTDERMTDLGLVSEQGTVRLPPRSIATLATGP